jgi:GT2 family glycosyltransferase
LLLFKKISVSWYLVFLTHSSCGLSARRALNFTEDYYYLPKTNHLDGSSSLKNNLPKVTIVVINWNGLTDTLECLRSIQNLEYPNYNVVVIDNCSKGNDAEIIRSKFGNFVCVIEEEKNLGFAGGNNVGIRWALRNRAKYVLLLNNDTVVDPSFLMELVTISQNDQEIGIVGPKIYYYESPHRIYSAGGKVNLWTGNAPLIGWGENDVGKFENFKEVDYVTGCALLIKEETIKKIGVLNETYFAYYEETEWCLKAKKAGFRVIYVPKARIWHKDPVKKTNKTNALRIYYMTRNRFIFEKRNSSSFQFGFFALFFLITDLTFKIKDHLFTRPKVLVAYLKGVFDGVSSISHQ